MSVLDFLFEGQAPQPSTTYGQNVSQLPQWYADYTSSVLGQAAAVGSEPYQTYGGPRVAGLTPEQQQAIALTKSNAGKYQPMVNQASGLAQTAAGANFPDNASRYMSPYITNVTDRAAQLTNRALQEKLLPGLEQVFGSTGQDARSSAYRRAADMGTRDLAEGLQSQNLAALDTGYGRGADIFASDQSRALSGAGTLSGLATTLQGLDLRDVAGLNAAGETQQNQTQRSLDTAYGDFQAQRDYPRSTLDWLANLGKGTNTGQTDSKTTVGPAPSYSLSPLAQLGTLASGVGSMIQDKSDLTTRVRRGGRIQHRYQGGALRYV